MGDLGYDDGLVHGHRWASEPMARSPMRLQSVPPQIEAAGPSEDSYDDGLVHSHGWARSN